MHLARKLFVGALCCAVPGCSEREGADATDGGTTESDQLDPAALIRACEEYCTLEGPCIPEGTFKPYDTHGECVAGCISGYVYDYANDCGPESFERLVCWTTLTCEQLRELWDTGFSACGDEPESSFCDSG